MALSSAVRVTSCDPQVMVFVEGVALATKALLPNTKVFGGNMKFTGAAIFAAMLLSAGVAQAQESTAGAIRVIVTGPVGGPPDIIARTTGDKAGGILRQTFIVENKVGGLGSLPFLQQVANAAPDGRSFLFATASVFSIMPNMYKGQPPYDPLHDFQPISLVGTTPNILVVNAQTGAKDYNEFIELLRKNPGKYNFGSGGVGTPMHLYGELLKKNLALQVTHVPYRGTAPAMIDLMANQVQFLFDQIPALMPHIQSGALVPLAVANDKRISRLPNVPTLAEVGIEGANAISWYGFVTSKETPGPIVTRLSAAVQQAARDPEVVEKLKVLGIDPLASTPEEMRAYIGRQLTAWRPLVTAAGITAD